MQKTQIIFLAAGMARRYGSLKQLEKVGPNQESLMEYTLYDAWKSGFSEAIFIIREDFEEEFVNKIVKPYRKLMPIRYVFQSIDELPSGISLRKDRVKPWGTAHALWCAKDCINAPFALVNADDFYGKTSLQVLQKWLSQVDPQTTEASLVGYKLSETLSAAGSVSRGVCDVKKNRLVTIEEYTKISKQQDSYVAQLPCKNVIWQYNPWVSLNCWGLTPSFLLEIESQIKDFFTHITGEEIENKEIFLPEVIAKILEDKTKQAYFFKSEEKWLGLTYPQDIAFAKKELEQLVTRNVYPPSLI